jgi:hypothetical protein
MEDVPTTQRAEFLCESNFHCYRGAHGYEWPEDVHCIYPGQFLIRRKNTFK